MSEPPFPAHQEQTSSAVQLEEKKSTSIEDTPSFSFGSQNAQSPFSNGGVDVASAFSSASLSFPSFSSNGTAPSFGGSDDDDSVFAITKPFSAFKVSGPYKVPDHKPFNATGAVPKSKKGRSIRKTSRRNGRVSGKQQSIGDETCSFGDPSPSVSGFVTTPSPVTFEKGFQTFLTPNELFLHSLQRYLEVGPDTEDCVRSAVDSGSMAARWLLAALLWNGSSVTKKDRYEAMSHLSILANDFIGTLSSEEESNGVFPFELPHSWYSFGGEWNVSTSMARKILLQHDPDMSYFRKRIMFDLLLADLPASGSGSLQRSFFRSRLLEVNLLPIISRYAVKLPEWYPSSSLGGTSDTPEHYGNISSVWELFDMIFLSSSYNRSIHVSNRLPRELFPLLELVDLSHVERLSVMETNLPDEAFHSIARMDTSSLKTLSFADSSIKDISPIITTINTSSLTSLDLNSTYVTDISSLSKADTSKLETLYLSRTCIRGASQFKDIDLSSIKYLDLSGTPVARTSRSPPDWLVEKVSPGELFW